MYRKSIIIAFIFYIFTSQVWASNVEFPVPSDLNFRFICLNSPQILQKKDRDLISLVKTLKSFKGEKVNGKSIIKFQGIPFLQPKISGIILSQEVPQVTIPVSQEAVVMYLLFSVIKSGKDTGLLCNISRDDGVNIRINLKDALNKRVGFATTKVIWKGISQDGVPLRFLCTTWVNDNEWYPINHLQLKLKDAGESKIAILGITIGNYKK